jgi:hypothetical protein
VPGDPEHVAAAIMADHQLSVAAEQPPPAPEPMKVGDTMEGVRNARYAARRPPAMRGGRRSRPMSAWNAGIDPADPVDQ